MDRIEISKFLQGEQSKEKDNVLADFAFFAVKNKVPVDKIGKLIQDLRSYPEWKWGE